MTASPIPPPMHSVSHARDRLQPALLPTEGNARHLDALGPVRSLVCRRGPIFHGSPRIGAAPLL